MQDFSIIILCTLIWSDNSDFLFRFKSNLLVADEADDNLLVAIIYR